MSVPPKTGVTVMGIQRKAMAWGDILVPQIWLPVCVDTCSGAYKERLTLLIEFSFLISCVPPPLSLNTVCFLTAWLM